MYLCLHKEADVKQRKMYKCKTCKEKIAENAINCPNCGDADPFWNKEIDALYKQISKKEKKIYWIIIPTCVFLTWCFLPQPSTLPTILFLLLLFPLPVVLGGIIAGLIHHYNSDCRFLNEEIKKYRQIRFKDLDMPN